MPHRSLHDSRSRVLRRIASSGGHTLSLASKLSASRRRSLGLVALRTEWPDRFCQFSSLPWVRVPRYLARRGDVRAASFVPVWNVEVILAFERTKASFLALSIGGAIELGDNIWSRPIVAY